VEAAGIRAKSTALLTNCTRSVIPYNFISPSEALLCPSHQRRILQPKQLPRGGNALARGFVTLLLLPVITSLLRLRSKEHYATSGQEAGSMPDEVAGFFNRPNPFSRAMPQGLTEALNRNEYQECSWGKKRLT
jgi:hypothetical protein